VAGNRGLQPGWLRGLFSRRDPLQGPTGFAPPGPEHDIAIIGDIHGRADLLSALLDKLYRVSPQAAWVFVGDYVDRGPDSKSVLAHLSGLGSLVICLRGNHEVMLLQFLDDPIEHGGLWLRNGGVATLASYGIEIGDNPSTDELQAARQALQLALADGTQDWLRNLPLYWQSNNLLVTHAGPDPAQPIEGQQDRVFLWGHNRFLRDNRTDGIWVAHGHWIRDKATCENGRIAVDTGAFRSGRLTAALISAAGDVRFVSAR